MSEPEAIVQIYGVLSQLCHEYEPEAECWWEHAPHWQQWCLFTGGVCAALATFVSTIHFIRHLCARTDSAIKACILKIVFIVPFYAMDAFCSLYHARSKNNIPQVLTFAREYYEAVVLVAFLQFVLNFMQGPEQVALAFSKQMQMPMHPFCLKVIPTFFSPGLRFLMSILWGLMQFLVVMMVVTGINVGLWIYSRMATEELEALMTVDTVLRGIKAASCCYAMYTLSLLYFELLRNKHLKHNFEAIGPESKFLCIKGVIMLTMLQDFGCRMAAKVHLFQEFGLDLAGPQIAGQRPAEPEEIGMAIQNFLICIEMLFFSLMHLKAYPPSEFQNQTFNTAGSAGPIAMLKDIYRLRKQARRQRKMIKRLQFVDGLSEEEVATAFDAFDTTGSGVISKEEFAYALQCARYGSDEIDALVSRCGTDGTCQITLEVFRQAFRPRTTFT